MNSAKSNWLLEELNWEMHPPGDIKEWDGLTNWFLEYTAAHPQLLDGDNYLTGWHRAARGASTRSGSGAHPKSGSAGTVRAAGRVRDAASGLSVTVFALDGDPQAERAFGQWRQAQKNDYFVTETTKPSTWMVHRPHCSSLTFGVNWKLTSKPKVCAARVEDLHVFAKRLGVELRVCSRCR